MNGPQVNNVGSPNENWGSTSFKTEYFHYQWNIKNFRTIYGVVNKMVSPTFSTGTGNTQWQIIMQKKYVESNEEHLENWFYSIHLMLVSCDVPLVPARLTFSVLDQRNVVTHMQFMNADFTQGSAFGFDTFLAMERRWSGPRSHMDEALSKNELTIQLDLMYVSDRMYQSSQSQAVQFQIQEDQLSQDFASLLNNSEFSDVILSVGLCEFNAHKAILAARSPVFAAMFRHKMVEATNNRVVIEDVEGPVFHELLKYIYTGKSDRLEDGEFVQLVSAADKYGLIGLKKMCFNALYRNFTTGNAIQILLLAERHGAPEVKNEAIKFMNAHSKDIVDSEEFKQLTLNYPHLIADIFRARKTD